MNNITVGFDKTYIGTIAKQGEHNETQLVFLLPDSFNGVDYVNAEFSKSNSADAVVEELTPSDGRITVSLTQSLTEAAGTIFIQLAGYEVNGETVNLVVKSSVLEATIEQSIEASQPADVDPSFIERLQAWLIESREILDTLYPDWDENDPTSRAYIANRTHWQEEATVTRNYTVEWAGTTPVYQQQPWNATELGVVLIEGKNYVLNVAGETFDGACQKIVVPSSEEVLSTVYYIGNIGIFDGTDTGNGFPVLFAYVELSYASTGDVFERVNVLMTYNSLFGNDLSFSITNDETVYHKLPNEYLDDKIFQTIEFIREHEDDLEKVNDQLFKKIDDNTFARHTHNNKPLLDDLYVNDSEQGARQLYLKSGILDYYVGCYPVVNIIGEETTNYYGAVSSNRVYKIGNKEKPASYIIIPSLAGMINSSQANEFIIEFYSGATPTSLTFPASVEWVDELTVEANKHYQISILDNVALWCAVDVEAVNE